MDVLREGKASRAWDALFPGVPGPARWMTALRSLATAPDHRRLRQVLLVSLAVQLVLAPLTSWWYDTLTLGYSGVGVFTQGNPYAPTPWGLDPLLDPPLGPALTALFLAPLSLFIPVNQFYVPVVGHTPSVVSAGVASLLLPIPPVLLLQKLPLILAALGVGVALYGILRPWGQRWAVLGASAWLLNPLMIWVTAIVGHDDALAALFVLGGIYSLARRWPGAMGLCLGLGTAAKLYPLFLLLPFAGALLLTSGPRFLRLHSPGGGVLLARLGAGLVIGLLPIWLFFPQVWNAYVVRQVLSDQAAGGMSIYLLYNSYPVTAVGLHPLTGAPPSLLLDTSGLILGLVILTGLLLWHLWGQRVVGSEELTLSAGATLLSVSAVGLLAFQNPSPENVLAPLVGLLIVAPTFSRAAESLFAALSATALGFYLAVGYPLAYFYPLLTHLGPGALTWADTLVLAYVHTQGPFSRAGAILVTGISATGCFVAALAIGIRVLLRRSQTEADARTASSIRERRRVGEGTVAPGEASPE